MANAHSSAGLDAAECKSVAEATLKMPAKRTSPIALQWLVRGDNKCDSKGVEDVVAGDPESALVVVAIVFISISLSATCFLFVFVRLFECNNLCERANGWWRSRSG